MVGTNYLLTGMIPPSRESLYTMGMENPTIPSPTTEKQLELIDPIAHMSIVNFMGELFGFRGGCII